MIYSQTRTIKRNGRNKMKDPTFIIHSAIILLLLLLGATLCKVKADDLTQRDSRAYKRQTALIEELAKPYDLQDTIKTLIYIESRNGIYPINLQDPACGITHININTYIKRHKLKNTNLNRNKACADLIASPKWAIINALEELLFWQNIHCNKSGCTNAQYRNVIKSYNAGWNYKGKKANEYWQKFKKAFKIVTKEQQ